MIYDLQVEADGHGDDQLLLKSNHLKKLMELCWDENRSEYTDNNFAEKKLSQVRTLASFMPLFVEMVDETRAKQIHGHLKEFGAPGGCYLTDHPYDNLNSAWNHPLIQAPYVYTTVKGLCDYELMEDAADIGTSWLGMVQEVYEKTGETWAWYNAENRSHIHSGGIENVPLLGWTAGVYAELIECLGLD
jgi:neutral trehalase